MELVFIGRKISSNVMGNGPLLLIFIQKQISMRNLKELVFLLLKSRQTSSNKIQVRLFQNLT